MFSFFDSLSLNQLPEIFNFDFNDDEIKRPWTENNGQDMD